MASKLDPPPTYTSQNFGAINDYIEHLANRHRARTSQWRSQTFAVYFMWVAILIATIGLVTFLVLWGLSLLKEKPEPRIVAPVVVDRPVTITLPKGYAVTNQVGGTEVQKQLNEISRRIDDFKSRKPDTAAPLQPVKSVFNYVIFKKMSFNSAGITDVVIGMEYKNPQAELPENQWCYVTKPNSSGTSTRVNLANKTGKSRANRTLSLTEAREMRVSLTDLKAAQRLCKFE